MALPSSLLSVTAALLVQSLSSCIPIRWSIFCLLALDVLATLLAEPDGVRSRTLQRSWFACFHVSRALSLRNLVLGYDCGIVFSAGVGPDLPSSDAANWLSSRLSRSVEMRRRYGRLRMVFTRYASPELQFGALREVVARERQCALLRKVWSGTATLYYRVSAHHIRRGRRAARSSTCQGSAELL